jgi:hypothetical protein
MADKDPAPEVQAEKAEAQHEARRGSLRDNMDENVRKASFAAMTQNVTGE